jgi:carbonic anhydrase
LLRESPIVRAAPHRPAIHGWVFGLREGLLTSLTDLDGATDADVSAPLRDAA